MRTALTVSTLLLLTACSASTSSRNIRTGGIVALIDVTSQQEGTATLDTELVIGGSGSNTNVILEGGDALSAKAGGRDMPLAVQGSGEYGATFPTSEGEFVVSLARDVDAPAPNSRGKLGPAFALEIEKPKVSRADALEVRWTPVDAEASVEVEVSGDCIIRERASLARDTGSVTFKKGQIRAWKKKQKQSCPVDVVVTRTRLGTTDPALDKDSRFRLNQVRSTGFTSTP